MNTKRIKTNTKGFTLVEIVVTIAILLVIVGIAIPSTIGILNRNKSKLDKSTIEALTQLAKNYIEDNNYNIESDKTYCLPTTDIYSDKIENSKGEEIIGYIVIEKETNKIQYSFNENEPSSCIPLEMSGINITDDEIEITSKDPKNPNIGNLPEYIKQTYEINNSNVNFKLKSPVVTGTGDYSEITSEYVNTWDYHDFNNNDTLTAWSQRSYNNWNVDADYPTGTPSISNNNRYHVQYVTYFCKEKSFDESTGKFTTSDCQVGYMGKLVPQGYKYMCANSVNSVIEACQKKKIYEIHSFTRGGVANSFDPLLGDWFGVAEYIEKATVHEGVENTNQSGSGLFKTYDTDGTTYYFRGNVDNNYVKLGDDLWQIMRINGDGTLRIVKLESGIEVDDYKGDWEYLTYEFDHYEQDLVAKTGSIKKEWIGTSKGKVYVVYSDNILFDQTAGTYSFPPDVTFTSFSDVAYNSTSSISSTLQGKYFVIKEGTASKADTIKEELLASTPKYYLSPTGSFTINDYKFTYGSLYTLNKKDVNNDIKNGSTLKQKLNEYYENNLKEYDSIISTNRFCTDHSESYKYDVHDGVERITFEAQRGLDLRLNYNQPFVNPTYLCPKSDYVYGDEIFSKIGTVTADDIIYAGAVSNINNYMPYDDSEYYDLYQANKENKNFYLYREYGYKTMTAKSKVCSIGHVDIGGDYSIENSTSETCNSSNKVYPVINLVSDVSFSSGAGTKNDPYIINTSNTSCILVKANGDETYKYYVGTKVVETDENGVKKTICKIN